MLIIFGGLPGTGKTTIAKSVSKRLKAVYLRIDTIEQALKTSGCFVDGPQGYIVGYAIAKENLGLGLNVVADSVNPIAITRQDWRSVAESINIKFIEVEIICSNSEEHKKRIETRIADIDGHQLPNWQAVIDRDYEKWDSASMRIDTAIYSPDEAVDKIVNAIEISSRSKNES